MTHQDAPRARRAEVGHEPLIGGARYDYADAFEVQLREDDARSAEQVFRAALTNAPWGLQWRVLTAHRYVLGLRLGPLSSPDHVLGWQVLTSEPDVIHLEATGRLVRGVLVLRKIDPTRAVLRTFVFYRHPATRVIWAFVSPLHRRIAPYLMERAAAMPAAIDVR